MASLSHHVLLAEELIATVARAFYTDHIVVVLDALIREKYLIEEEIGPRLKLSAKETRKVVTQLENEMLIKSENVPIDGDSSSFWKCLYIDYQSSVNAIRYRVYLLQQSLTKQESSELTEVQYKCPTCKSIFSSLDAMRLLSADHKFICSHCCPYEKFKSLPAEPFFTLLEIDNRKTITSLQTMQKKLADQFRKVTGLHQGIFDLLSKLREVNLPRNLPSENIKRGFVSSAIEDEEVAAEIRNTLSFSRAPGGSYLRKRSVDHMLHLNNRNNVKSRVEVQFGEYSGKESAASGRMTSQPLASIDTTYIFEKREAHLPEFLQNSRVVGAEDVYRQVQSLQRERISEASTVTTEAQSEPTSAAGEESSAPAPVTSTATADGDLQDEDFDDVAWED